MEDTTTIVACATCAAALTGPYAGVDNICPWDRPDGWEDAARDEIAALVGRVTVGESWPTPAMRIVHCGVCGMACENTYFDLEVSALAVDLPSDIVRVGRIWHRDENGKAVAPLDNDGGDLDVLVYADDLESLLPALAGWIGPGKFSSMVDRFENCSSTKITDRVGALLESLECAVTVRAWAAGDRPARGAIDTAAVADIVPGARKKDRVDGTRAAERAKLDVLAAERRRYGDSNFGHLTYHVRGVNGLADQDLSADEKVWNYHLQFTAGWARCDQTWIHTLRTEPKKSKVKRALVKLIETGDFVSNLV